MTARLRKGDTLVWTQEGGPYKAGERKRALDVSPVDGLVCTWKQEGAFWTKVWTAQSNWRLR